MTTCLGKSCSFGILCVSIVKVCEFVCVFLSLLVLRVGCATDFLCSSSLPMFLLSDTENPWDHTTLLKLEQKKSTR